MKTTVEIPGELLRQIKAIGAAQKFSMKQFIIQAILDRLARAKVDSNEKPWMKGFGKLKHLKKETRLVLSEIEEEFGKVNPKEWE